MHSLKEVLSKDMKDFLVESKWETHVKDSISELMQYRPDMICMITGIFSQKRIGSEIKKMRSF